MSSNVVHSVGHPNHSGYPMTFCGFENKHGKMKFDTWERVTCKLCQGSLTANSATTRGRYGSLLKDKQAGKCMHFEGEFNCKIDHAKKKTN